MKFYYRNDLTLVHTWILPTRLDIQYNSPLIDQQDLMAKVLY